MFNKNYLKPSVLCLLLVVFSCCVPAYRYKVSTYQPIRIETEESATISFKRVLFQIPTGTKIGESNPDGIYAEPVFWETSIQVADEMFNEIVNEELMNAGYPVIGTERALFDDDDAWMSDYLLGAKIVDIDYYSYSDWNSSEASITVKWELFDKNKRAVIYRKQTQGVGRAKEEMGTISLFNAFRSATRRLLIDESFVSNLILNEKDISQDEYTVKIISIEKVSLPNFHSREELVRRAIESVVTIKVEHGFGSGFIISGEGYLLTNHHVIKGKHIIDVLFSDGLRLPAEVIQIDQDYDLALLNIQGGGFKSLPLSDSDKVQVGEEVFAIGTPAILELSQSVTNGIISGFRSIKGKDYIQTDAAVNPGNSGGPLINQKGEVLGIVTQKAVALAVEGISFCVPIDKALRKLGIKQSQ